MQAQFDFTAEDKKETPPPPKPGGISYQLAHDAYRGTSWVPEERAEQILKEYAGNLKYYREQIEKLAGENGPAEYERFEEGYTRRYRAWLQAESRCLSTMLS